MTTAERKHLNQKIQALRHRLNVDDDTFRSMVLNIEPRSDGHITHCDDETANLILISLRRIEQRRPLSPSRHAPCATRSAQNRQIARLMDYLHWSWKQTSHLCHRMTGTLRTDKCTPHELSLIIRAMVHIIDNDIASGKLKLADADLNDYMSHTIKFRKQSPSPSQGEPTCPVGKGRGEVVPDSSTLPVTDSQSKGANP